MTREYRIDDEGDEVLIALMEDGLQVGGAMFPDDGTGSSFDLARQVGEDWISGD